MFNFFSCPIKFLPQTSLKRTLKLYLTVKPEILSVAIMVMAFVVPTRVAFNELIMIELPLKLSQIGSGDAAQVIINAIPEGFVTTDGSVIISGVPK